MDYKKEMRRIYTALGIEPKPHSKGHKKAKKLKYYGPNDVLKWDQDDEVPEPDNYCFTMYTFIKKISLP